MWAQLEEYLIQELDSDTARTILTESQTKAHAFLAASDEPSPTRRATMQDTILPRVATYLALKEAGQDAEELMERYTRTVAGPSMHAFMPRRRRCPSSTPSSRLSSHGHPEERRLGERVRRPEGAVHPGHPSVPVV